MGLSDIIILCTDGLTDNLYMPELGTIVPLLASLPFFDRAPATPCRLVDGAGARLPRYADLAQLCDMVTREPATSFTPERVVSRLQNYLTWVTAARFGHEQAFFAAEARHGELRAAVASTAVGATVFSDPAASSAVAAEMAALEAEMAELRSMKKDGVVAGKTDDTLIVAFLPLHQHRRVMVVTVALKPDPIDCELGPACLGLTLTASGSDTTVLAVGEGSAAQRAGVEPGHRVCTVDQTDVTGMSQVSSARVVLG